MSGTENKNATDFDVDIGLLIKLVQNFPYLYNNQLQEFKNISLRERTWSKIAASLKVSVEDCQRVWRNLRDKYGKEKRLNMEYPGSSKWEFYDSMHFLKPFIKRRRKSRRITRGFHPVKIDFKETEDGSNGSHTEKSMWEPIKMTFSPQDISVLENDIKDNGETEEITLDSDIIENLPIKQINQQGETINIVRHHSSEEAFGAYIASRLMDFDVNDRQAKKIKIFKILEDLDDLS